MLLDDFLVAENSSFQSEISSPVITSERAPIITSSKVNQTNITPSTILPSSDGLENTSAGGTRYYSEYHFLQLPLGSHNNHVSSSLEKIFHENWNCIFSAWIRVPWRN